MNKNIQMIAGNLADTAVVRQVSDDRDCLSLRVITGEQGNQGEKLCSHSVVQFGKRGQFDKFVERCLQKGMGVFVQGIIEKKMNGEFLNVNINTSFEGGSIDPVAKGARMNKAIVAGNLASDAVIREAGDYECLSYTVITNHTYYDRKSGEERETSCAHDVVQFSEKGKKGQFNNLAELLKKGAGVYVTGATEKKSRQTDDKTYLNVTINATGASIHQTRSNLMITQYVTEKKSKAA